MRSPSYDALLYGAIAMWGVTLAIMWLFANYHRR